MGDTIVPIGQSERVAEIQEKRASVMEANAAPFPGSTRDAFSIVPDIKVDKYSIRPFYDGDYDILTELNNPLSELMAANIEGREAKKDYVPRGQPAYEICYLFTTAIEDAVKEIKDGTFKENARNSFFKLRLAGLIEIHNAVMKQLGIYWSTTIGYGASDEEDSSKKNAQA